MKVPTWIDNSKEGFFNVGARFEPMLESKENDAIKTNLPFRPIFAVHQITRFIFHFLTPFLLHDSDTCHGIEVYY